MSEKNVYVFINTSSSCFHDHLPQPQASRSSEIKSIDSTGTCHTGHRPNRCSRQTYPFRVPCSGKRKLMNRTDYGSGPQCSRLPFPGRRRRRRGIVGEHKRLELSRGDDAAHWDSINLFSAVLYRDSSYFWSAPASSNDSKCKDVHRRFRRFSANKGQWRLNMLLVKRRR